jgi:hypothetical protein
MGPVLVLVLVCEVWFGCVAGGWCTGVVGVWIWERERVQGAWDAMGQWLKWVKGKGIGPRRAGRPRLSSKAPWDERRREKGEGQGQGHGALETQMSEVATTIQ